MRVEKEYRHLEGIEEIRFFNASKSDFYRPAEKEFDVEDVPLKELIENVPVEIHSLIPHDGGRDFIIQRIGNFTLEKYGCTHNDVKGRLLSKLSPLFFEVLHDELNEVYTNHEPVEIRFVYYGKNKLTKLSKAKIVYDAGRIFVSSHNIDTHTSKRVDLEYRDFDEDKNDIMENFSQTGSYYNVNGKYTWSQGIYNILNRPKEESDDFYNIVFDLAIPEDHHIIRKIFSITNSETSHLEEIIRIRTKDGILKTLGVNINSYFDERGIVVIQGIISDVNQYSQGEITKPVDFLLDGFKNSTKLALLIEPLNHKQFKFSKGFYYLIEKNYEEFTHSRDILENIVEDDITEQINAVIDGKVNRLDETITYNVNGNPENQKVIDFYIERFNYGNRSHSLGFLTDITEERNKQEQLMKSNDERLMLIKELHHRVKNNLQILSSFLNLEKRAYKDNPDMIIDHMEKRLNSLALVHESTYNSDDFKNINLNEYLMNYDNQTSDLIDSNSHIDFETYADEDINLTIEVITPLLLIIDEITVNAVKYAFPDKTANNKLIKNVNKSEDGNVELIFMGNSSGVEDLSVITRTLSYEIIMTLTKQLGGSISVANHENSVEFKLVFPIEMEHTIEQ